MAEISGNELRESARHGARQALTQLKTYLAQESPRRLSEADTKAHFIDPIITALGWTGIGTVTREYYVRNSQEFIDYVMFGPRPPQNQRGPLLAIEAKALQHELTEKHAAQLIQYCSVEGIEWAALANGRELQFFNTFLKPDLEAKRVLKLDLLAFNTDEEFDALFDQLWRLSRESLTEPSSVRTWLNQLRLDAELRQTILNPSSQAVRQLRRHLNQVEINASANDIVTWFRTHLAPPLLAMPASKESGVQPLTDVSIPSPTIPVPTHSVVHPDFVGWNEVEGINRWPEIRDLFVTLYGAISQQWDDVEWRATKYYIAANVGLETFLVVRARKVSLPVGLTLPQNFEHPRLSGEVSIFRWKRVTRALDLRSASEVDDEALMLIGESRRHIQQRPEGGKQHYGITLKELIDCGLLTPGIRLVLKSGIEDVAEAELTVDGQILLDGVAYETPSNITFARLLGPTRTSLNGWTHWYARFASGDVSLGDLRRKRIRDKQRSDEQRFA